MIASLSVQESVAFLLGGGTALATMVALIYWGRPLFAVFIGALSWGGIGFLVGLAAGGEFAREAAILCAVFATPIGGVVAGIGAGVRWWIRHANRRKASSDH